MDYFTVILILTVLAFLPWLLYFIYYSEFRSPYLKFFIIGGVGWLVALFLRLPLLQVSVLFIQNLLIRGAIAAILAGIFEEGTRYIFLLKSKITTEKLGTIISFGVGWGLFEVWILHSLNMISLAVLISVGYIPPNVPPPDELLIIGMTGVVERWIAVSIHIIFTLIIINAVLSNKRLFVIIAIVFHALVDFIAVVFLVFNIDVWNFELLIFIVTILIYAFVIGILKIDVFKYFRKTKRESNINNG
ncbi:MAG: YhfC family glutamic-type intramembrane protease [Candidatus Asgardarchaeia archaeon]